MITIAKRLACVITVMGWIGLLILATLLDRPPFSTPTPDREHVLWFKGMSDIVYITPQEQRLVNWTVAIACGAGFLWLALISLEARLKRSPQKLW